MRFSQSLVATLVASVLVSAAPVRRAAAPGDVLVLQFAHVLEQLETQFYTQALQKFSSEDFVAAGFADPTVPIQQFMAIQNDEATHTSILESTLAAIGAQPISGCNFNFDSVLGSVSQMAPVARVVEDVGVAAYIGALHLMTDPTLMTAAASIATVEARHQTVLNLLNGGTSIPQAFDIPFTPSDVLAIASPFISGCTIPVPANPTLSVTNTGTIAPGTLLTFSSSALNGTVPNSSVFCQMLLGGAPQALVFPMDQCMVPTGINGPVALFITSDNNPISSDISIQGKNLIAGPDIAYIDTVQDQLALLSQQGSASSDSAAPASGSGSSDPSAVSSVASSAITDSAAATATVSGSSSLPTGAISSSSLLTTITPDQASSIVASASAAATATDSAAGAAPTASAANDATSVVQQPGGPNLYTGPVANGTLTVVGWQSIPKPQ